MQIAHRRDEGGTVLAAQLVAQFLDRADDFHDGGAFGARDALRVDGAPIVEDLTTPDIE
jgi:hypothetical protein